MAHTPTATHRHPHTPTSSAEAAWHQDSAEIDPQLRAVLPDEPYSLLTPGLDVIQARDIKRLVGDGMTWCAVDNAELGTAVPVCTAAYARITPPEGFVLAADDDPAGTDDILWSPRDETWISRMGQPLEHRAIIARSDPSCGSTLAVALPARHRALYPREKLRGCDKLIYDGIMDWQPVTLADYGQSVALPNDENGHARYCRPVHPFHQNWYVDEETGQENHLGGTGDPWPSLAIAQQQIEHAARAGGVTPYGTIWTTRGVPLTIYDMPVEPPTAENTPEIPPGEPVGDSTGTPTPYTVSWLAHTTGITPEDLVADARRQLPRGWRYLEEDEEIAPSDLLFQPLSLHTSGPACALVWQAFPQDGPTLRQPVGDFPVARRIAPSNHTLLHTQLRLAQQQYKTLGETLSTLETLANELGTRQ